jgi:hypothetical protein
MQTQISKTINSYLKNTQTQKTSKFYLKNIADDVSRKKYMLKVLYNTEVSINYGSHTENMILTINDEVRWDNNVIILHNQQNHYKSTVSTKQLIITAPYDSLINVLYNEPNEQTLAAGTGWEAMQ